jgi:hypothetical protein
MKKSAVLFVLMSILYFAFAQVTFDVNPVIIKADNYYDYQIGGYNGFAIEKDQTSGNLFMTYMYKSSSSTLRQQRYAYFNAQGMLFEEGQLISNNLNEGFGTLAIDQSSGNAFFVWHRSNSNSTCTDVVISVVMPNYINELPGSLVFPSVNGQHYLWPVVYIGTSPFENMRRIHVFANKDILTVNGTPGASVIYAYADFNDSLFNDPLLMLEWNYTEFPYFTSAQNSLANVRPYPSFAVKDNRVVIGGYVSAKEGLSSPTNADSLLYEPHDVFFLVNENYGSGEFTTHTFNTARPIPSPVNSDGQVNPADQSNYVIEHYGTSHVNMTFSDSKVHFPSIYACSFDKEGYPDTRFYWPLTSYVKDVSFIFDTQSVFVSDLEPKGDYPQDGLLAIPWDFDENGMPDSFDEQGNWKFQCLQYPYPHHDTVDQFHNVYLRQSNMNANQVSATVWNDALKAYIYHDSGDLNYQQFASSPEVYIAYSYGQGTMGLDLDIMNAVPGDEHYTPQLANLRPVSFHIAKEVDVVAPSTNRINMMFLNDYEYGCNSLQGGNVPGGDVMFASIIFHNFASTDEPDIKPELITLKQNYPNPFNPSTQIAFELKKADHVNLCIYNVKGQLVKTLADNYLSTGSHSLTWNGEDQHGHQVGSGVYFYRLETSGQSLTRKMLLMK